MHDALVVDQHSIGNRVIVADNRIDKFMNECVAIKTEFLDGKLRHFRKEPGAGHVRMLAKPSLEAGRNAIGLRHSADSGRMLHHTLALGHRKLTEQEKPLARCGRNPVRIAAAGIKEGCLGRLRCCLRQVDQFVLDLEWTQSLEFTQCHNVGHDLLLLFARLRWQNLLEG
jgi:hypothetical protein